MPEICTSETNANFSKHLVKILNIDEPRYDFIENPSTYPTINKKHLQGKSGRKI